MKARRIGVYLSLLVSVTFFSGCEQHRLDQQVKALCAKDGGIKVYETVMLPAERFDPRGFISIPDISKAPSDAEYYRDSEINYYYQSGDIAMWRRTAKIVRRSDQKVLGMSISYTRRGGDIPGPWHPSSYTCPEYSPGKPQLETSVFSKGEAK